MFDRFTEDARKAMSMSRQEAQRLGHEYIGTEHMLFGLLSAGSDEVGAVLRELGVDEARLRQDMERRAPRGKTKSSFGQIPFTPRAKHVLEAALAEAQDFQHDYIAGAHLLLGLVRVEDGIAGEALREQGVTPAKARAVVRGLLGDKPRTERGPLFRPGVTIEVVGRDGVLIAKRLSTLRSQPFGRGDVLRLDGAVPALRIVEIEHVFGPMEGAQTLRLITEPAERDPPQP